MKFNLRYSNKVISLVTLAGLLVACGGGGGSSTNTNFTSKNVSGVAIDLYLKNATVTLEDCPGKPTVQTDTNGIFNFTTSLNCQNSALSVAGGIDIGTNLPFTGKLKYPKLNFQNTSIQNVTVTSLTTIQAILTDSNQQNALSLILANLGVNTNTNISSYDYVKSESSQVTGRIFVIQQMINQLGDQLQTSGLTEDQALNAVITGLATVVSNSPNVPLFNNSTSINLDTLSTVIDKSINNAQSINANVIIDATTKADLKNKINVLSNALNQSITNNPNTSIQDVLKNNSDIINATIKAPTYNTISVAGYPLDAIRRSSADQPLSISLNELDTALNIGFQLSDVNSYTVLKDNAKVAFLIEGNRGSYKENLNILINNVAYTFNTNGQLQTIIVPKGAEIKIASTLKDVNLATFTIDKDITINANGVLSLNSLVNSSTTLVSYYKRYINLLAKNDMVKTTVYVIPNTYMINTALNLPTQTVTVSDSTITGSNATAYFLLK